MTTTHTETATSAAATYTLYSNRQRWMFLCILFLVAASNYADRSVLSVLLEPIKREFGVSDTMLGLLGGLAFAVLYSVLGIPVARWADRGSRPSIITMAICLWSLMCALCGMAQTFWQLLLARAGVGIGEAGASPPAQSLLIDYFPPSQHARAIAVFGLGASAGSLFAFVAGSQIAAAFGWRYAFILIGLPGLLLALATALLLREPRNVLNSQQSQSQQESVFATLRVLWRKPTYRYTLIGITFYAFFAYGVMMFVPAFMVRVLKVDVATVGTVLGSVSAVATVVGSLVGGWLTDRMSRSDRSWLLKVPAIALVVAFPLTLGGFTARDFSSALPFFGVGGFVTAIAMPGIFVAAHAVCGSARRAMSVAILLFFMSLIGGGLGPLAVGLVSDALTPLYGVSGLVYALMILSVLKLVGAACFWYGSRSIVSDAEA